MALSSSSSRIKGLIETRLLQGQPLTSELLAILLVYFVQGVLGLARLAISFFLKDDLGLSPASVAALTGIAALPWTIKPLFGMMSDGLPVLGYRRRPYLILSGLLGVLAWLALATVVHSTWAAIVAITCTSLSVAVGDVIVDSMVVERARGESQADAGTLQSLCWGATAVGGLFTAYLGGLLLERFDSRTVFAITASFPLLITLVAGLIGETPSPHSSTWSVLRTQAGELWGAVRQRPIWMPSLFMFLWQATPSGEAAFFFFTTNDLGFEPEFLGRVRLVSSLAALIGIGVFQRFLRDVPFRQIFGWSTVLSALLGMTMLILVTHANRSLGIDDRWFSLGDSLVLTVMGQIAFMPVLVLSARLCPAGVEATLFALLMSVLNLAGLTSHELGALLTRWLGITENNFDHLWQLVLITNLTTLLPLPLLFLLPAASAQAADLEAETTPADQPLAPGPGLPAQAADLEAETTPAAPHLAPLAIALPTVDSDC
ncbi:MAG: folate/biopterin family MFS transporter [Cyanobacteria bacterium REEB459]|nr:folate/biopterin family MFS transporter [Cyanobacteria bacterium REEB459]